jgi:TetR/AcrR family transcriptional regulator, fatty acid metabolism regulator protein
VVSFLIVRSEQAGTKRTFIEEARRRQLIGAAIEQLAEAGYAGTSLAAIASRAGISKAAVLYHFTGGKDELLDAVVSQVVDDATTAMTEAITAETTLPAMLRAYITSNVGYLAGHRREILALLAVVSGAGPRPDGSSLYEPISERTVAELAGLLRAGQEQGAFGRFHPVVLARTIRGSIDAIEPLLRHHPEVDLGAYAAELVTIFEKVTAP